MSYLKTKQEIEKMRCAGKISALAMKEVEKAIKPGVSTKELDELVESFFKSHGAGSAFKKVENYQFSICVSPNDWVVHGLPGDYRLKEGDIIGVDLGAEVEGYNSDMAQTFAVGRVSEETKHFLETGEKTLWKAIKEAKLGNRVGDISAAIQEGIEGSGYSVVKELVGHGVGRQLHEDPMIPGRGKAGTGEILQAGLVIAIEVIYNRGKAQIVLLDDGWTIATRDGSLGGLYERTLLITEKGSEILTAV